MQNSMLITSNLVMNSIIIGQFFMMLTNKFLSYLFNFSFYYLSLFTPTCHLANSKYPFLVCTHCKSIYRLSVAVLGSAMQ